jgi:Ca2+:H+ antiporter
MVFQLYSHSHYYNPDVDLASEVPSRSSSRSSSSARVGGYDGATPTAHDVIPTPAAQAPTMSPRIPGVSGSVRERMGVRRAHSMPFGSAARLGFGQRAPAKRGSLPQGARGRAPPVTPGQAIAATAHSQHQNSNAMRRREYFDRRDVEIAVPKDEDSDSEDEGPEDPELNIPVALGTLLAATGLTCELPLS